MPAPKAAAKKPAPKPDSADQRRNKRFDAMHQQMIETAVSMISKNGADALSLAAISRELGINRTTLYYHFTSREALIEAVNAWSAEQLVKAIRLDGTQQERLDYVTRFVVENPQLIKLWIDDLIAVGDIRARYPQWDILVDAVRAKWGGAEDDVVDAEVYCVMMLTSAIIGPRVFKNSVCPDADADTVVRRFRHERQRLLKSGDPLSR